MACDSLYSAYLKVHYPYEFYKVMLKLFTEKRKLEKIAAILREMSAYRGLTLKAGTFGEDNRDWLIDREKKTISQSLSSVKSISQQVAEDLYNASRQKFDTFADMLVYLQNETCLKKNNIELLIGLGYFAPFGKSLKLMQIFKEFTDGKNRITKTLVEKNAAKRLEALRAIEKQISDEDIPVNERLSLEYDSYGFCLSRFDVPPNYCFVQNVDETYGIKLNMYNIPKGVTFTIKVRKDTYKQQPVVKGTVIDLIECDKIQKSKFVNGLRIKIPGQFDWWLKSWSTAA